MEPRFSLRTLLEVVFVVAVVLTFNYQTNWTPAPPVGRYQLENAGTSRSWLIRSPGRHTRRIRRFALGFGRKWRSRSQTDNLSPIRVSVYNVITELVRKTKWTRQRS